VSEGELFRDSTTQDFIKYGFEPEFIGRLPVRVVLNKLTTTDLLHILQQSEGSVIRQYEASFRAFGIDVLFAGDGLAAIAELAEKENTGARGLLTVCERTLRDFKYELPSSPIRHFVVTRALVEQPGPALDRLLRETPTEHHQFVREYERKFAAKHNLRIRFDAAATAALIARAQAEHKSLSDLCATLFKDYQFGLHLIQTNTGQTEFEIPADALENPDKFLSDWVVHSYKPERCSRISPSP